MFRRRPNPAPAPGARADRSRSPAAEEDRDWRAYDAVADEYARVVVPRVAPPAADLVRLAGVRPGWRVLDLGTGTGVVARVAAEVGADVVGVDPSLGMLRAARREGGRPLYVAGEAIDLPFPSGSFDAVLAGFVFAYFRRHDTALFDILRVVRLGGMVGMTAWGHGEDEFSRAWRQVAEEFAGPAILRDAQRRALPGDETVSEPERLKDVLYRAGLRRLRFEHREYRFDETREEYLAAKEIGATGRFLHQMLGDPLWERFRARTREVFTDRFPPRFTDFRDVNIAIGTKPA